MLILNRDNGQALAWQVEPAYTFIKRLKGLLFTSSFPDGCAMHIRPCRSVHTYFMKYSIDVIYLDAQHFIVGIEERLQPGKLGKLYRNVNSVIELPAGKISETGTLSGQQIEFQ